uniref:zinc finger MYM-type protein 1-like n=1 Tax=Ciona intestinalis TaxID=7719 RepID=UPI0002B8DC4F|nr:zinc finger MYM-type protein 1-like [Ciona intestinalis]|eukprot:XP_026694590.1 zinc finger MYM-type protein 1-like [Ciona intestinalis]
MGGIVRQNREFFKIVIDTVKLCGRQNFALRGHRDSGPLSVNDGDFESGINEGNFRALLRYKVSSGDKILLDHIKTSPRNATYISWQVQNEIINLYESNIRQCIVNKVKDAVFYSVLADETSDVSLIEQLSICVRYVEVANDNKPEIREDFLGFVAVENMSGHALANSIIETLKMWGLDLSNLRGQGYDGAANMAMQFRGVQAHRYINGRM